MRADPQGQGILGDRELLSVLSCSWNFTVQGPRALYTHTHTHTHTHTAPLANRSADPATSHHLCSYCLVCCYLLSPGWVPEPPHFHSPTVCLPHSSQREAVKTYNPPPPSSAQNRPRTPTPLRVKGKGLQWPLTNSSHHLSFPPLLHQPPRCS